jgi:hypothetical protein
MRQNIFTAIVLTAAALLSACETMTSSHRASLFTSEKWALLPIENFSSTPLAGDSAKALVETHLRSRGVTEIDEYKASEEQSLLSILDSGVQLQNAKKWAIENGYRYAVTGKVQEWRYKNGVDNEPAVGMSLKFTDLATGKVLWQASASRTGWGYSNLTSVASKTVGDLVAELRIRRGNAAPPPMVPATLANGRSTNEPAAAAALPAASSKKPQKRRVFEISDRREP